jgi:hypothetical protein
LSGRYAPKADEIKSQSDWLNEARAGTRALGLIFLKGRLSDMQPLHFLRTLPLIQIIGLFLSFHVHAQTKDKWLGNWVEGERGARIYTKIRIEPNSIAFSPGGNSDYYYFAPQKNRTWCQVKYKVVSQSHGDTYPDEQSSSQDVARRMGRTYEIALLELEHAKCSGFSFLQMAFPSDLHGYADVTMYDKQRRVVQWFNYHQVVQDNNRNMGN